MRNWRVNFVFILIILFGAAIISRLIYLQIWQYDYYRALAQGQKSGFQFSKGNRGEVFFSGGQVLATNIKNKYVFVSPQNIEKKEETAEALSKILNLNKEIILEQLKKDSLFEKIKDNITEQEESLLLKLNLPGVHPEEDFIRKYPQNKMASQIIGFFGGQDSGQYGIEGFYNDILSPKGLLQDQGDILLNNQSNKGDDIFLTLDYNIQYKAEQLLEQAKKDFNIKKGQIIVMDPNLGKILALAVFPDFDPNKYSEVKDFEIFQNPAVQSFYEPGSVFKTITMASALDQEKITPETTYVDKGQVQIEGWPKPIYNYGEKVWGEQTMTNVLEKSINTGAVFAEAKLGHDIFLEYLRRFGLFEPTRIDLQGEVFSENRELKRGRDINFATASFGQGIELTPLQMARALCAIANGGKLVKPYIVEKIVKDGKTFETKPEISESNIISSKTATTLTEMLISVVEKGSAKYAKVPRYNIAGKTGTSQVSFSSLGINKKGYSDETWQSFMGFAPAFNPKFLILIKLDNPQAKTSEYSAAPIFGKLADYILNYLETPPDYE